MDHPLVQFKQYCVEINEILLLVAEWWIAQHTTCTVNQCHTITNQKKNDPYTDFIMNPWWDVVTSDLISQHGGFGEAVALQTQLQQVCQHAADLFNHAMMFVSSSSEISSTTTSKFPIPSISAHDIAIRIGACEQNAMGIRQRSPLCRDIILDASLRKRRHVDIIHCLEDAGFIGEEEDDDDDDDDNSNNYEDDDATPQEINDTTIGIAGNQNTEKTERDPSEEEEEVWDYSVEEITAFLANLHMDEDGSGRDLESLSLKKKKDSQPIETNAPNEDGDDLDKLFPPLDGTAMYSRICKMNHSCDPNVVVVYPRRAGWGSQYPLTAFCIAIKDIRAGDELTISYIDPEQTYADRQAALANYGFRCRCSRCILEEEKNSVEETPSDTNKMKEHVAEDELLFGSESENEETDDEKVPATEDGAEAKLQERLERLDTLSNQAKIGALPPSFLGPLSVFLMQTSKSCFETADEWKHNHIPKLLKQCLEGIQERDYELCKIVGSDLESMLFEILKIDGQWPSVGYREAYWCATITTAVARAHNFHFLKALCFIDKGIILGLPRNDDRIDKFIDYVELHASSMYTGPYPPHYSSVILPDYCEQSWIIEVTSKGLSKPLKFPVEESNKMLSFTEFEVQYLSKSRPVVIRSLAANWLATKKWRSLDYFSREHGHRLVPVEHGSMMSCNMKEEIMPYRHFVDRFLRPSFGKKCWSLQESIDQVQHVAYVAQHPLLTQMSALQCDVNMVPDLCGPDGPTNVNFWMGTGGTRTPLHYDTYENIFVQLVGSKYIRLYGPEETQNLYVSKKSDFGMQGNLSDLDCEREDDEKHPAAKLARYTEVLLKPGDVLFIPSKTWHYVRSLTTSISVNYWF
jgi:lysine-specific demethylase 8